MWHTPLGNRVLRGAEGKLFQTGLESLVSWIDEFGDEPYRVGVSVFDSLSRPEKLAILERAARALLLEEEPMPELTAVLEGAAAAVYAQVLFEVDVEIDEGGNTVRKLIRRAAKQCDVLHESSPGTDSDDVDGWHELVETVMDSVFWDRDWEVECIEPDDLPENAAYIQGEMGIASEYYSSVGPDPSDGQMKRVRESLKRLCCMDVR